MAVLRVLSEESEPIGMPELLAKLGSTFKERSVRRWINLLVKEGAVQKIGEKRGTKYVALGRKEEAQTDAVSSRFSSSNLQAIEKIKQPLFERMPVSYNEDWFADYVPNTTYYLPEKIRNKLVEAG